MSTMRANGESLGTIPGVTEDEELAWEASSGADMDKEEFREEVIATV